MALKPALAAIVLLLLAAGLAPAQEQAAHPPQTPPERTALAEQGPTPKPITPPTAEEVRQSIQRGVAFILAKQKKDGSWGSPHNTKGLNIYAPVPGAHQAFITAVTALCVSTLIEAGGDSQAVTQAIERGEAYLFQELPKVRRATPDAIYNVWTHGYGISALVHMRKRLPDDKARIARIDEQIRQQMDRLQRYESVDGGWGYYDFRYGTQKPTSSSISFVSAMALVAFAEARDVGIDPPKKLVDRAIAAMRRQQKPDLTYMYGEYLHWRPMLGINRAGGSLGRSQACNLALRRWGDKGITDGVLKAWLNRLVARNLWLDMGRKRPVPHESWFQVAGYFYYFGHYYAALCIDELPPQERAPFQDQLAHVLLSHQEKDGSWWDFPFYDYHQQYGTAMAVMALVRCQKPAATDDAKANPAP